METRVNSPNRGGTAFLIRNEMSEFVYDIDRSINDQIWFRLSFIPEVLFGGCYIPPSDSLCYDDQSFSHIVRKRLEHPEWKCVLFGDFNSRFGPVIQTLVEHDPSMDYRVIDPINNPNQNGNRLLGILRDCDLLIINNLRYGNVHFDGQLTYRLRSRWVSELDFFIVSRDIIASICQFSVNTSLSKPSDHAPISLSLNCAPLKSHRVISYSAVLASWVTTRCCITRSLLESTMASHDDDAHFGETVLTLMIFKES